MQKESLLPFEGFELFSQVLICNELSSLLSEQQTVDLPISCTKNVVKLYALSVDPNKTDVGVSNKNHNQHYERDV